MSVEAKLEELFGHSRRVTIQNRERFPEVPDPIPLEVPVGCGQPPTMREMVQEYVQTALSEDAVERDLGSFEEEDDFEPENPDVLDMSGFEVVEFPMDDEPPPGDEPVGDPAPAETPAEPSPAAPDPAPPAPPLPDPPVTQ